METNCIILWIEIYQVNSAIPLLNNWGQIGRFDEVILSLNEDVIVAEVQINPKKFPDLGLVQAWFRRRTFHVPNLTE